MWGEDEGKVKWGAGVGAEEEVSGIIKADSSGRGECYYQLVPLLRTPRRDQAFGL